jgi:hypothetical protein
LRKRKRESKKVADPSSGGVKRCAAPVNPSADEVNRFTVLVDRSVGVINQAAAMLNPPNRSANLGDSLSTWPDGPMARRRQPANAVRRRARRSSREFA